jgi:hypothetical protein
MSHLHFTRHEIVPSILLCLRDSSTPLPVLAAQRTKIHAKSAPPPRIDARVPLRAAAIANRLMKADRTVRGSERRGGRARLNAPDSKSGIPLRVSGVRIPPSPPLKFHGPIHHASTRLTPKRATSSGSHLCFSSAGAQLSWQVPEHEQALRKQYKQIESMVLSLLLR